MSARETTPAATSGAIIIDHRHTHLADVPLAWVKAAKSSLRVAYGHSSHGSQIITGMTGLAAFANAPLGGSAYAWNDGGPGGALDLADTPFSGATDLGSPDYTAWVTATRHYLDDPANADVNVVMWSWCGQVSYASQEDITNYLTLMNGLEQDYPDVSFVYMTGHTDGSGLTGSLHLRNQQIRDFCNANGKILYDFEDIESYDPDGTYFGDKHVADSGDYDGGNWAIEWQSSHRKGVDWYECDSAHSQPLNANLKAYAAWWLWARLAGWNGLAETAPSPSPMVSGFTPAAGPVGTEVTLTGTGFTGATAVTFGGTAATSFTLVSSTQLTATVPAGATSGPIAVTAAAGTGASATSFTVTEAPVYTLVVGLELTGLANGAITLGKRVTARGTVTPASLAGGEVMLTVQKKNDTEWVEIKSLARPIDVRGSYIWKYRPVTKGVYRMHATIAETAVRSAARTPWRTFTVVPQLISPIVRETQVLSR